MRKQFDIKYRPQIESGEYKVETRDGKKVRVLCYDANNITPVVALVTFNDGSEGSRDYYHDGSMNFDRENPLDLFIVTPEPTEFEKRLVKFYNDCNGLPQDKDGVYNRHDLDELLHNTAAELLALAEKEIAAGHEHEVYISEDIYYEQLKKQWEDGYNKGRAEALKDLPRWKKIGRGNNYSSETEFTINGRYLEMNDTLNDVYESPLSALEKLPIFKED